MKKRPGLPPPQKNEKCNGRSHWFYVPTWRRKTSWRNFEAINLSQNWTSLVKFPHLLCFALSSQKANLMRFIFSTVLLLFAYKQAKCQLNKCYKCNKTFLNYTDVIIPKHVLLLSCPNQLACPSKQNIIISLTSYWSTYQRSHNQQNLVYLTLELKPWTFPRVSKGNFLAEPRTI